MATINSLRLVSPKYQWIVRPGPSSNHPGASPKRLADGEEKADESSGTTTMEVVELKDIEKELVLTQASTTLYSFSYGKQYPISLYKRPDKLSNFSGKA